MIKGRSQFSADNLTKILNIRRNEISCQKMLNIRRNARSNNFGAVFRLSNLPICSSLRSIFQANVHRLLAFLIVLHFARLPTHWKLLSRQILIYLLTYSMMQSPSWEANWFAVSQEIPRISRNPNVHYRTHKRPSPVSILGQPNPVHIPTSHLLEIHPYIIHPSKPRSPQWSPSLRFPHQDAIHPLSSPIRATCPAHLILLDFITRTLLGEEYKSFSSLLCSLLHSSVTSSFLGPNILQFIMRLVDFNVPKWISELCVTLLTRLRVLKCYRKISGINKWLWKYVDLWLNLVYHFRKGLKE